MVLGLSGVGQSVNELLQPSLQSRGYLLRFCRSFEVIFWFSQIGGGTGAPMGWAFVVSGGASVTS